MSALIATSVVRGSQQGESHGGVYLIDVDGERVRRMIDWNTANIDWQGRGWDRGLRGIAFDGERVFIAASDELFAYTPDFELIDSWRNPYLKHCHEIVVYERRLFVTSTGFDAVLGFDLDNNRFSWGLHIMKDVRGLRAMPFSPNAKRGPAPANQFHINSVHCNARAMFVSGLRTDGLHAYTGKHIRQVATLPAGTHNARPHLDGVLFNDTEKNVVRFVPQSGSQKIFNVPFYNPELLTHTDLDDSRVARQAFGRGLCTITDNLVAAGSSPSTVTLYDLKKMQTTLSINLSMDIRNAVHGLEVWPFSLPD